jgi:hypothetical protein
MGTSIGGASAALFAEKGTGSGPRQVWPSSTLCRADRNSALNVSGCERPGGGG